MLHSRDAVSSPVVEMSYSCSGQLVSKLIMIFVVEDNDGFPRSVMVTSTVVSKLVRFVTVLVTA